MYKDIQMWADMLNEAMSPAEIMKMHAEKQAKKTLKDVVEDKVPVDDAYIKSALGYIARIKNRPGITKMIKDTLTKAKANNIKLPLPYDFISMFVEPRDLTADKSFDQDKTDYADATDNAFGNSDADSNLYDSELDDQNEAEFGANKKYKVDLAYIRDAMVAMRSLKDQNMFVYDKAVNALKQKYNSSTQIDVSPEEYAKEVERSWKAKIAANANKQTSDISSMSRANLIASVANRKKDEYDKIAHDKEVKPIANRIKTIWLKKIDQTNPNDIKASLEMTFEDGKVENTTFPLGKSGDDDELYKQCERQIKASAIAKQRKVEPIDIYISMMRVSFADNNIKWFYGPQKNSDSTWVFTSEVKKIKSKPEVKAAAERKAKSPKYSKILLHTYDDGVKVYYDPSAISDENRDEIEKRLGLQ